MADRDRKGGGGDVDLWEHVRYDDTVKMSIDEDDIAAAVAAASADSQSADSQSVDDLLAEIEALADDEDDDDAAVAGGEDDDGPSVVRLLPGTSFDPEAPDQQAPDQQATDGEAAVDDGEKAAEAVVLHPRMRDRRIAVRRDEGRRRLRRLAWGMAGLTLVVDGAAVAQTPFVDVDHIVVEGGTQTGEATVRWASGVHQGDALLTLDEHGAEGSIEQLSWVATADVKREWPSTVRIVVHERVPAVVLQSEPGLPLAVVDAEGRVLQIGGIIPPGLVTITGVPREMREGRLLPGSARDALTLAMAAPALVPGAVTTVSQTLEATLTSGGVVRFGSLDELDEKLVALATVLARVDTSCLGVLDVKVPGSPTVSRRPC
jgi:cell division septal protein FtsQ